MCLTAEKAEKVETVERAMMVEAMVTARVQAVPVLLDMVEAHPQVCFPEPGISSAQICCFSVYPEWSEQV